MGGASAIALLIAGRTPLKEVPRGDSVQIVAAFFASMSAISFPGMSACPGIH